MAGWGLKTLAFLSSYGPLWIITGFSTSRVHWVLSTILIGMGTLFPILAVAAIEGYRRRMNATDYVTPVSVTRRDSDVIAYLFTYVLPFLALDWRDPVEAATFTVFAVTLFLLYINTNLLYVNPALTLSGYRIFEVQTLGAPSRIIITRQQFLPVGEVIPCYRLVEDDIGLDVRPEATA